MSFFTEEEFVRVSRHLAGNLQDVAARLQDAVEDLDETVKHIRTVIFGLEATGNRGDSIRERIMALTREASGTVEEWIVPPPGPSGRR